MLREKRLEIGQGMSTHLVIIRQRICCARMMIYHIVGSNYKGAQILGASSLVVEGNGERYSGV